MPYPLTAVQLRDPEGAVLTDAGVDGEIWIRGRNVVRGYWNRPDDTAALLAEDGSLRTRDAGHLAADGFPSITDRIQAMPITGGEHVSPAQVARVLAEHPYIP